MATIEKVLADARMLVNRLKEHDNAADAVIGNSQNLHHRVNAMKQYQEDLNELNEIARHRPRANLVLSIAQENNQIRELQQENRELRASLEEHQSALELIMSKYREQVLKLLMANKLDETAAQHTDQQEEIRGQLDKICEMAAVMWKAIELDEGTAVRSQEIISQLRTENHTLRELVLASHTLRSHHLSSQTRRSESASASESEDEECETRYNTMVYSKSAKDKNNALANEDTASDAATAAPVAAAAAVDTEKESDDAEPAADVDAADTKNTTEAETEEKTDTDTDSGQSDGKAEDSETEEKNSGSTP